MAHKPLAKPDPIPAVPVRKKTPTLPAQVVSPTDVIRLATELGQLDDALLQLKLRSGGDSVKLPKTSRLMELTVEHNKLNLLRVEDRKLLMRFFTIVGDKAPRLHFSFSADPSAVFLETLIAWLRNEVHPHVLVTVGLQPSIGAGCIVRSTNKYFDFSLRQTFFDHRKILLDKISLAKPGTAK